ncbi:hypothetical protein [Pararhodobacter aggregans]|uniref:hypothetical protein n=1 Tax=Pararhodobacter aggregans TaxID=404875 RepID=UPI003A8E58FD
MLKFNFLVPALAFALTGAGGTRALADVFVGGGFRSDMTHNCDPSDPGISTYVTAVGLGYRPGQSNDNTSTLTVIFLDGTQQIVVFQDVEESRFRYPAYGIWTGVLSSYNNIPRPRLRAVHLRVIEPSGGSDIGTADQIFVRFQVSNYWRTRGCTATFTGTLTNATTAAYTTGDTGLDRPSGPPPEADAPDFVFEEDRGPEGRGAGPDR